MSQEADAVPITEPRPLSSDEFKALIDAMKGIHDGLFDRGFKISAALVGVLGWFGVKSNPLPPLCKEPSLAQAADLILMFAFFSVAYLYVRDYHRAKECETALSSPQVRPAVYSTYRLTRAMITVGLLVQLGLFSAVGLSIHAFYAPGSSEKACDEVPEKPKSAIRVSLAGDSPAISRR
jgi:hypothetical protein